MNVKLVVVDGEAEPATIRMRLPIVAGRGRQANLVVPHPQVSRVHCEICEADGALVARDLGSLNGTFVNEQRISEATLLPGDTLSLGGIAFLVEYGLGTTEVDLRSRDAAGVGDASSAVPSPSDARTGVFLREDEYLSESRDASTEPQDVLEQGVQEPHVQEQKIQQSGQIQGPDDVSDVSASEASAEK
jgi:pSer/pThr/pTyr-binding forkhead associated (FHA) protein